MRTLLVIVAALLNLGATIVALFAAVPSAMPGHFSGDRVGGAALALTFASILSVAVFRSLRAPAHEASPSSYQNPHTWHQRMFLDVGVRVLIAGWGMIIFAVVAQIFIYPEMGRAIQRMGHQPPMLPPSPGH